MGASRPESAVLSSLLPDLTHLERSRALLMRCTAEQCFAQADGIKPVWAACQTLTLQSFQRSCCQRISDAAELCLVRLLESSLSRFWLDADTALPSGENSAIA